MFTAPRRLRSLAALAAAALALGAPGGALAQGAGDEQYKDPFGELPEEDAGGGGGGGGGDEGTSGTGDEPTTDPGHGGDSAGVTGTLADTEVDVTDETTAPATGTGEELARTGLPVDVLAGLGLSMLAAGAIMHALTRRPLRRARG